MRSIHSCGASLRMLAVIGIATFGMIGTVIAATFNENIFVNGSLGVGVSAPQARLQVQGSAVNEAKLLVRGTVGVNPSLELGSTESGSSTESGEGFLIRYMNDIGETIFNNVYTASTNAFRFQSGGSDRLVIQSGGNVGIGTGQPLSKLDVSGSARFHAQNDAGNTLFIENQARTRAFGFQTAGGDRFVTNLYHNGNGQGGNYSWSGTASALNLTNGNMGIGTIDPLARLHVSGGELLVSNGANGGVFRLYDGSSSNPNSVYFKNVGMGDLRIVDGNEDVNMSVTHDGRVGIGTSNPDQKLTVKGGGIGFDGNSADKKLYSPVDGVLEWFTHDWATEHGFSVSHQGARRVFLNTNGASYFAGGRLGVGTTDPQAMLHVEGGSARDAKILVRGKGNTNPSLELGAENGANLESGEGLVIRYMNEIGETIFDNIYNASINAFRFQSGGSDRFVIQSGGNIGVSVPNPSERLEVNGNIKLSGSIKSDGDICIGMCE